MNRTSSFNPTAIPGANTLDEKIKRIQETCDNDDGYYNEWESTDDDDDDIYNDD